MRKEENAPPTSLRKAIPQLRLLLTSWGLWVRPSWPDHTMASIMNQRTWILMLQAEVTEKSFKKALSRCQCVDRLLNNNKSLEPLDTVTQNRYAKSTLLTRRFKGVCGQPSAPGARPTRGQTTVQCLLFPHQVHFVLSNYAWEQSLPGHLVSLPGVRLPKKADPASPSTCQTPITPQLVVGVCAHLPTHSPRWDFD